MTIYYPHTSGQQYIPVFPGITRATTTAGTWRWAWLRHGGEQTALSSSAITVPADVLGWRVSGCFCHATR